MPRIYVACLASYNNGVLHGRWIDLDGLDEIEVQDEINAMLRESKYPNVEYTCAECGGNGLDSSDDAVYEARRLTGGISERPPSRPCPHCDGKGKYASAEEYAVHDYDDLPSSFGEHPSITDLVEYVEKMDTHGDVWTAYVEHCRDIGADPTESHFEDCRTGEADSELAWVENFLEECGTLDSIPEHLRRYFNTEAYLRDMKLNGDVEFVDYAGTTYAFWRH